MWHVFIVTDGENWAEYIDGPISEKDEDDFCQMVGACYAGAFEAETEQGAIELALQTDPDYWSLEA